MRWRAAIRQMAGTVAVVFLLASVVQAAEAARLLTKAKVNVYREGKLVQVLHENAPLPEGALLRPEGDCGVRMAHMGLAAKAGSAFAVLRDGATVELDVESGTVYFAANGGVKKAVFKTPAGVIVAQQLIIRAAAEGLLKGFVQVEAGKATLGVLEGGDMVVSTVEGERVIRSGEQIVLVKADGAGGGSAGAATLSGRQISHKLMAAGLVAAGAVALGIMAGSGSDNPAPVSPSSP